MAIKEWNAQEFYNLYHNIEEQCLQYCLWIPPYICQSKECNSELSFVCDNEFDNNDADLPIQLQNSISIWSIIIYNALNYEKVLPTTTKTILAN